ncbi:MAG TPA: CoA transferase [Chloroflexi bacterium]|nr:CoA transferase [Chloroflexota bacterium]
MRPLEGLRVLDLTRLVAGGLTGMLLADFGAEVVKVERPSVGDPLRAWTNEGRPFWWQVYGRNKKTVTLNITSPEGLAMFKEMLPTFDVLLDSFVPGKMESWGLDWETLHALHPKLIWLRISGWGQTGPGSNRPGFGTLVEASTGMAAMMGEKDGPPLLPSFPIGDMVSGLYACNAIMFALYHRQMHDGAGQMIDVSLFESLFSLLGPLPAEYAATGKVRLRQGSRSKNSAPRGAYQTSDGEWIAVSGSTPKMAEKFLASYGLGHLLADERFATNEARVNHAAALDEAIQSAIGRRTLAENLAIINENKLTAIHVQTIADIERDPHWQARRLTVDVSNGDDAVRMHNVVPRMSGTPGEIHWPGAPLEAHTDAFYQQQFGLSAEQIETLREKGVI